MRLTNSLIREGMKSIKLICYDFDGVMTDNKAYVDCDGREMVQINRADGLGISEIRKKGIKQLILSTESNPVVNARALKLKIPCLQGVKDKAKTLKEYCYNSKISMEDVIYIGNDINDLKVMQLIGTPICPADATQSIKKISHIVLDSKGGDGVARELLEFISKWSGQ